MNVDQYFRFDETVSYVDQNPLDYLIKDDFHLKPRSSMESNDRQLEIPNSMPLYISRQHRDSGRSRRQFEPMSP